MNKLTGKIVGIQSSDNISLIDIDVRGNIFSSIILEGKKGQSHYTIGDEVGVLFKETEVGIAKNLTGMISFRNRFKSRITKIEKGKILTKVTLDHPNGTIGSIISTSSAERLGLKEMDDVEWLIKSNEVMLMKGTA